MDYFVDYYCIKGVVLLYYMEAICDGGFGTKRDVTEVVQITGSYL